MFVIIIAILAFLMSFSIGANDAANALATSYGSKALKLIWLVILGSIFEFIGAYFCSGHVAGELIIGIIPDIETLDDDTVAKMMLGASIASFIFIMASSVFGMPISGTHTVIGALIGCGIAGLGAETIDWGKLGIICIGWVVAPLLAIIMTCLLILAVCNLTMNLARSFQTRLLWLTVFTACASAMIAFMLISLIKDSDSEFTPAMWACLGCSPILGLFVTRLIFAKLVEPSNKIVQYNVFSLVFKFWSAQAFEEILHAKQQNPQAEDNKPAHQINEGNTDIAQAQAPSAEAPQSNKNEKDLSSEDASIRNEKEARVISELYRFLMLVAAMMVCLGHGSNDVANSISPLLQVLTSTEKFDLKYAYVIGSVGIALGLLCLGYRVMDTMGNKVVKLDFAKGFSAQFATAISVNSGSIMGLPLSTTHCMVGALVGLIVARKLFGQVRAIYPDEEEQATEEKPEHKSQASQNTDLEAATNSQEASKKADTNSQEVKEDATASQAKDKSEVSKQKGGEAVKPKVDKKVILKILAFWVASVPVGLGVAYGITKLLLNYA